MNRQKLIDMKNININEIEFLEGPAGENRTSAKYRYDVKMSTKKYTKATLLIVYKKIVLI